MANKCAQTLGSMNKSMNIMAVQKILQEFERESTSMDMKDEIMNDTIEDAIGTQEDEMGEGIGEGEESDAILREVLDEIGLDMHQQVRVWMYLTLASSSPRRSAGRTSHDIDAKPRRHR